MWTFWNKQSLKKLSFCISSTIMFNDCLQMAPMVISLNNLSWNFSEISGRFCYNCPAKTYPTSNIWHMAYQDFSVPVFKILERFDQSEFRLNASQSKNAEVMLRKLCKNTKCNCENGKLSEKSQDDIDKILLVCGLFRRTERSIFGQGHVKGIASLFWSVESLCVSSLQI